VRLLPVVASLALLTACGPGPGKLAVATEPGVNNVSLVIENPGPEAARLLILLNERILFDERVEPSDGQPPIAARRWTTLPDHRYRIDILDRLSGRTASARFRLRGQVGIHVFVLQDAISIATTDNPREPYE
jgi:hypothetical protein